MTWSIFAGGSPSVILGDLVVTPTAVSANEARKPR